MGIRFSCHICNYALHVKDFQAGKRGRCPECHGVFRIPIKDASYSSALDDPSYERSGTMVADARTRIAAELETKLTESTPTELAHSSLSKSKSGSTSQKQTSKSSSTGVFDASNSKAEPVSNNAPNVSEASNANSSTIPSPPTAMPASLAAVIEARWFIRPPSGGQYGPAASQLLMNWIMERRVTPDSLLWREGLAQWQAASVLLPELFSNAAITDTNGLLPTAIDEQPSRITSTSVGKNSPATADANQIDSLFGPDLLTKELMVDTDDAGKSAHIAANALKRKRQRDQQVLVLIVLAVVSLALLSTLVWVLVSKSGESKPTKTTQLIHRG